jgi:hypothetical protein
MTLALTHYSKLILGWSPVDLYLVISLNFIKIYQIKGKSQ